MSASKVVAAAIFSLQPQSSQRKCGFCSAEEVIELTVEFSDKIGFAEAAHATRIQVEYLCVRGKEARGE
jgi:hypothetical protein